MTLKLKSTANELRNGWKLAWYHNFTHVACAKKLCGLREKLYALRVQTGNLLRSIRVSDKNSSITNGFHIFKHNLLKTFSAFNMHHLKPHNHFSNLFWLDLLFFMHFMIYFELNDPEIDKHCKWTLKRLKDGIVS